MEDSASSSLPASGAWDQLTPGAEAREFLLTARAHFASLFPVGALLSAHDDIDGMDLDTPWTTLVDHGYTAVGLPESAGGMGEFATGITLVEEAGRALLPLPLTASAAAAYTAVAAGIADDSAAGTPMSVALAPSEVGDRDTIDVFDGRLVREVVVIAETPSGIGVERREVVGRTIESQPMDPARAMATLRLGRSLGSTRVPSSQLDHLLAPARPEGVGDAPGQRHAVDLDQRLVPTHAPAGAAAEHGPDDGHPATRRCRRRSTRPRWSGRRR